MGGRQAIQLPVYVLKFILLLLRAEAGYRRMAVAVKAYALGMSTGLLLAFSTFGRQNEPLLVGGLVEIALGTSGLGAWRLNLIGA
jgi:hypothetical protein